MAESSSAGIGTAHLSSELESDGPYTIHGVALGAGDVTLGSSGIKKQWPGEELKDAADTLEGKPLVRDHQNDSEGTVGTVTKSTYRDGVGVLYEAEIAPHYEQLAQDIAAGILDVSARAYHADTSELEKDDDTGALITEDIVFDNLSIVSQGASPSNSAKIGEATAMAEGPSGNAVAVMERGGQMLDGAELQAAFEADDADTAENRHPGHAEPTMDVGTTPEWEEGDIVRWQVEPDLFGKIVHVDDEKHVAMVEIMGMDDGELTSTGFTITAGFSDITPMKMPESKSDMKSKWKDDEDMAENEDAYSSREDAAERAEEIGCSGAHEMEIDGETMYMPCETHDDYQEMVEDMTSAFGGVADELAEVSGMDINGLVQWDDDMMGSIADFVREDGTLMVEIDVVERDDGRFEKTGETVRMPLDGSEDMQQHQDGSVEELEAAWHTPDWDGLDEDSEWSKPNMEDFDTDDMADIDDHFFVSKTGEWPPEDYGDLALPCVFPNGDLSLDGLDSVHQMAKQTDGIPDGMAETIQSKANELAKEHFDEAVAGEEMASADEQADDRTVDVASLGTDDDPARASTGGDDAALRFAESTTETMTDITYESIDDEELDDLDDPVVMERDDVEDLQSKADRAEELDERLDSVNSTLDELADNHELLDDVDESQVEELAESEDPTVLSGEEYDELTGLVDDVAGIYAEELAEHAPFDEDELRDRFTPMELRDKVEAHEDASIGAELGASEEDPEPEGGSADEDELSTTDADAESEKTIEELREEIADEVEQSWPRQAEQIRNGDIDINQFLE